MKKILLASIVTLVALNVSANSEDMPKHPLDTDKDGLISKAEAQADSTLSAIFDELDVNDDGYLSHLELEAKSQD